MERKQEPSDGQTKGRRLSAELREIRERCAALPVLDDRPPDELLGYDEMGLPNDAVWAAGNLPKTREECAS